MGDKQDWIVTSRVYRLFQRNPEKKFDNGIDIFTYVYAENEESAKKIAEQRVREDFFVDEYRFIRVEKRVDWIPPNEA